MGQGATVVSRDAIPERIIGPRKLCIRKDHGGMVVTQQDKCRGDTLAIHLNVILLSVFIMIGCSHDGRDGAAGAPGTQGANCFDGLEDQDGDGELTSADCLWAVLCPAPIDQLQDANGDGTVDAADCREALRGQRASWDRLAKTG